MRDETSRIVDSVRETIAIGERGKVPAQVTHHKVIGAANWGRSIETLRLIDEARGRGVDPCGGDATAWHAADRGERGGDCNLDRRKGNCAGIFHAIGEEDLERILRHPATMIASDGEIPTSGRAVPHPRSYGTFARVLAVYVRERNILTLEDAVRKMTLLPAQRLGLLDRGVLRPGLRADVAVFDPARVRDAATFQKPRQWAEGFSCVIVNGEVVFEAGAVGAARPGRVVYGPAVTRTPASK
jgi:N-acyl-D-aspartate/D-glutamate deacylase